jgi:hypothetical protein
MAAPSGNRVYVHGAAEVAAAFHAISRDLERDFTRELKSAGEIVRDKASYKLAGLGSPGAANTAGHYRARVRKSKAAVAHFGGIVVTVDNPMKKTTGLRPDWGATQMTHALLPALDEERATVVEVLSEAVFALGPRYGFH